MRSLLLASLTMISTFALSQNFITDPKQLQSKSKPDMQNFSVEKLFMTRDIGDASWSPDGKKVAFVANISGRDNVWLVPSTDGWPTQLTVSNQRQHGVAWSPDNRWIAYVTDYDGDEQWDIHLVSPQIGDVINLTATHEIAEDNPSWSPDGKFLAYEVKPKTASATEIDVMEVDTRKTRHITTGTAPERGNFAPRWSRDGKWLAYTQGHATEKDSNVFIVELATGKATNLTLHEGEHNYAARAWSPDGKALLITSNVSGYDNVGLLDVATKKIDWLTQDKWEMTASDFSPDGRYVTWTANIDGNISIFLYDVASRKSEQLPLKPGMNTFNPSEFAFSRDSKRFLYHHAGAANPDDIWVYDIATRQSQQLTNSLVAGLRSEDMVEPYVVHYPSTDGKFTISAFVYVPNNIARNGKYPAIVSVHGGPAWQTYNNFYRFVQYMVNQGYVVIAPNYRGSTGFGKAFTDANRGDGGGQELRDVVDAAEWIKRSGYVDPKKLVVMGASYGGYLSMMAVTKYPDIWAAGVPIVPFVNWFTEFESEDPWLREYDRATMGDPVKNKALWEDRSPVNFVDRVKAPLLLLAGGNDPRCPKAEAQQLADAIKKRGGVVQLKIYEDEGHGFSRVDNQIDAYKRVSDFLKTYVPSPGCGCSVVE